MGFAPSEKDTEMKRIRMVKIPNRFGTNGKGGGSYRMGTRQIGKNSEWVSLRTGKLRNENVSQNGKIPHRIRSEWES